MQVSIVAWDKTGVVYESTLECPSDYTEERIWSTVEDILEVSTDYSSLCSIEVHKL